MGTSQRNSSAPYPISVYLGSERPPPKHLESRRNQLRYLGSLALPVLLAAGHRSREPVERRGEYGGQRGVHPDPAELPEIVSEPLETVSDPGAYRCDRSCKSGLRTDGPSEEQREQGSDGHRPQVLVVVAAVLLHLGHHRGKVLGVLAVAPGEQAQDDTADDADDQRVEASEIGRDTVPDGCYP